MQPDLSAEERARECLAAAVPRSWRGGILSGKNNDWGHIRPSEAIAALIAFEAAAIERAADTADSYGGDASKMIASRIRQLHSGEGAGRGEDRDGD